MTEQRCQPYSHPELETYLQEAGATAECRDFDCLESGTTLRGTVTQEGVRARFTLVVPAQGPSVLTFQGA